MNKTQMLLNFIKDCNGASLEIIEPFATQNDIKTYKGLLTKSKNQSMLELKDNEYTITQIGIDYLTKDPKKATNTNKAKREIVKKSREQENFDLQLELKEIINKENMIMNTLTKNRIVQICNRMILINERATDHSKENNEVVVDDNDNN